jgi:hypothetical protein
MTNIITILIVAILLSGTLHAVEPVLPSSTTVASKSKGKIPAAQDFDIQGFIDGQIKAGSKRVVIPQGRYRVIPKNGTHLLLKNLTDIEIIADGVEMICTETRMAISIEKCSNLHLRGLAIDYDPLPFTQGRIVALAPDKSWVEFQIIDGYPDDNLVEQIEIYDPATKELRRSTYFGWNKSFERTGPGRYRISKGANFKMRPDVDTEQEGDILVTNADFPKDLRGHKHAVLLNQCAGVKLENVTLYASPMFGFFEAQCEGNTYLRCKIDRRAPSEDPVQRGLQRMRSLDADAFHSWDAAKGPSYIDCVAKFNGDDSINIHGRYAMITACNGNVVRITTPHGMTIEAGDPVEFLPFEGERPPDAVVNKIVPDEPITEAEKTFVKTLRIHPQTKEEMLSGKAKCYLLTLDRPVTLPMGSLIASSNRVGNGFLVKGCEFGYNRSRGILVQASHGQIINNTITRNWMTGVLVNPEYYFFEAGSASDIVIDGNKIIGCHQTAMEIVASGGNGTPLPSGAHNNIKITNNVISDCSWPNIRVTSISGLVIRNNKLTQVNPASNAARPENVKQDIGKPISVVNCQNPDIQSAP